MLKFLVLLTICFYTVESSCNAPGYTKASMDGKCYKVSKNQADYYTAARDCYNDHAHLVTIENAFQQSMILSFAGIQYPLYIGYNAENPTIHFRWDYPATTSYTNFLSPDGKQHGTCTIIQDRGDWYTQPATGRAYYVCQYDDPAEGNCGSSSPNALPFYYEATSNSCILISNNETTYYDATNVCKAQGAAVMIDNNANTNSLIDRLFCWECYNYDQHAYIGMKYINNSFVYQNGKRFNWQTDYSNFISIDHSAGDCVTVSLATGVADMYDDVWVMSNCNGMNIPVCIKQPK